MGQALYRKYRSKSFNDVVGQDHITKTLKNALASGKISHAYLFTGPRGVGKTSVARILAHEVNQLPYTDESVHLDIIEIDAASNRRIDEIRDLRDKVNIAPSMAKFKVYIIDEVHMLTREAFNALLKTLEEPPAHCIFILATTEAHKLPETIVSRTQRYEFKAINSLQAAEHLAGIAKEENIDIEPAAIELLARLGAGSFRDSISYLDQLSAYSKKITADDVRDLLGWPGSDDIKNLLKKLSLGEMPEVLAQLNSLQARGIKPAAIASGLSESIRRLAADGAAETWHVELLGELLGVQASTRPQETLEIILLTSLSRRRLPADSDIKIKDSRKQRQETSSRMDIVSEKISEPPSSLNTELEIEGGFSLENWDLVVDRCKKQAASIYTALRLASPSFNEGILTLSFQFPLHQKKLELAKNKDLVSKIVKEVFGDTILIKTALEKKQPVRPAESVKPSTGIASINNIFGAAEVIEA